MVIEAMMKTLLDEYNPEDMKRADSPRNMFLEAYPDHARYKYCQAVGHFKGEPVMFGFDRVTDKYKADKKYKKTANRWLVHAFHKAAKSHGLFDPVGAIFTSDEYGQRIQPSIIIDLHNDQNSINSWNRNLMVHIVNYNLKASPHSRIYWEALEYFKNNLEFPVGILDSNPSIPLRFRDFS